MKFTLEIDCDNAAFAPVHDDAGEVERVEAAAAEVNRILRRMLDRYHTEGVNVVCGLQRGAPIRDTNGNRCGQWDLSDDEAIWTLGEALTYEGGLPADVVYVDDDPRYAVVHKSQPGHDWFEPAFADAGTRAALDGWCNPISDGIEGTFPSIGKAVRALVNHHEAATYGGRETLDSMLARHARELAEAFPERFAGEARAAKAEPSPFALAQIADAVDAFEAKCEAEQHTDTGAAWEVFHTIRDLARGDHRRTFRVEVTQSYNGERTITLEVSAEDLESAVERVRSGDFDLPSFDDPRWESAWNLTDESAKAAE